MEGEKSPPHLKKAKNNYYRFLAGKVVLRNKFVKEGNAYLGKRNKRD